MNIAFDPFRIGQQFAPDRMPHQEILEAADQASPPSGHVMCH